MALSPAEKQRRYRERLKAGHRRSRTRKPRDRRSRAQRWRDAVAELLVLQEHYRRCLDNLPDALHDTPYGERLQAMVNDRHRGPRGSRSSTRLRARHMTHGTPLNTVTLPPPGTDSLLATQATLLTGQGAETSMNRSGTPSVDILSTQSHQTVTNTLTWKMDADSCMSFIIGYGFLLPFASPLRQWGNLQTSQVPA